jgi:hypothetical protein
MKGTRGSGSRRPPITTGNEACQGGRLAVTRLLSYAGSYGSRPSAGVHSRAQWPGRGVNRFPSRALPQGHCQDTARPPEDETSSNLRGPADC